MSRECNFTWASSEGRHWCVLPLGHSDKHQDGMGATAAEPETMSTYFVLQVAEVAPGRERSQWKVGVYLTFDGVDYLPSDEFNEAYHINPKERAERLAREVELEIRASAQDFGEAQIRFRVLGVKVTATPVSGLVP